MKDTMIIRRKYVTYGHKLTVASLVYVHRVIHNGGRWVWSTGNGRRSNYVDHLRR